MVSTAGTGLPAVFEGADVLLPGFMAGPWRVERELGRGGMGAVYAVVHEEIGKRAALKVVHQRLMPSFNSDRMLLEAKVVNQVGHPNIVDIFETGKLLDGRPYIVMERLYGQSLSARADEGKLLPDVVIGLLLQVCDALIAAHAAGVVHRDLKLDNVFLTDNPDEPSNPKIKLLDWGIAKVIHHDVKHTIEGQLMGTPQYLSPEQARGLAVSPETDVYSLGVMAYELFLEQLPFEAETAAEVMAMHLRAAPPPPSELWPDIPNELEALLLSMLAKQADRRPTMMEVARRLEAVREELGRRRQTRGLARASSASPVARGPRGSVPPALRIAPRSASSKVASAPGFAPTESLTWRSETRRWQYAIGALALALSGLLFWISRDSDHTAVAATAPLAESREITAAPPAPTLRIAPEPRQVRDARPAGDVNETAADDAAPAALHDAVIKHAVLAQPAAMVVALRSVAAVEPEAPARPVREAASRSPAPRIAAPRSSAAHSSPAAPRLRAKIDPDGTLDVYR